MPIVNSLKPSKDLSEVHTLHDHPALRPLFDQRQALQARLDGLHGEITAVRNTLYQLEYQPDVPLPIRTRRDNQDRLDALLLEEEAVRAEQQLLGEQIEGARRQALAELRPVLDQKTLQILEEAQAAMEALAVAQAKMQAFGHRASALGLGFSMFGLLDHALPSRLKRTRELMDSLRARQVQTTAASTRRSA